ncbi:unnamed protein product [Didymodactylos carnosus]|uniref:Coilin tudor domain-containing protein n=1 Tax=Didymodactylos carnosus TaxID=1234261 RepID=A0A814H699_9BILA|nr:unnamed protein product [Didymodactylos carnosus]CAF3776963.1 unnamed protein product [Didymodactylos carnosus]
MTMIKLRELAKSVELDSYSFIFSHFSLIPNSSFKLYKSTISQGVKTTDEQANISVISESIPKIITDTTEALPTKHNDSSSVNTTSISKDVPQSLPSEKKELKRKLDDLDFPSPTATSNNSHSQIIVNDRKLDDLGFPSTATSSNSHSQIIVKDRKLDDLDCPSPTVTSNNSHSQLIVNDRKSKTCKKDNQTNKSMLSTNKRESVHDQIQQQPTITGRMREIKSTTPAWKVKQNNQVSNGNNGKLHIRFDSSSEDEDQHVSITNPQKQQQQSPCLQPTINNGDTKLTTNLIKVNGVDIIHLLPENKTLNTTNGPPVCSKPKQNDLVFDLKQCKTPTEKVNNAKLRSRQRAQHRKRMLDNFSLAKFIDHAFGVAEQNGTQDTRDKLIENGITDTQEQPKLPKTFSKFARLPLIGESIKSNNNIYDLYPPIQKCPPVKSRIAFKLLELDENFSPKMTEFKEGTVVNYDENSCEVVLQLDEPLPSVFDQPSKFYTPDEDEAISIPNSTITLPFAGLYLVRLLSS